MKIRIQGNSLRIRLTQPELDILLAEGVVQSRIYFGPGE